MNTHPNNLPLTLLCDTAIRAAKSAASYIQNIEREQIVPHRKDCGSSDASQIVTAVDLQSETIIREHLAASCKQWDIAFVGEESANSVESELSLRHHKPYYWCVDPLDGTQPFVAGLPGYAVAIALLEQSGTPLIGVVCDPVNGDVMHAIKNHGAFLNGSSLTAAKSAIRGAKQNRQPDHCPATGLQIFADNSFKSEAEHYDLLKLIETAAAQCGLQTEPLTLDNITYGNGAVKNACQALRGSAACYLKLPKPEDGGGSIWDFAATACLAIETGGWVSNVHGHPLDLNRKDSTFMNHQGVIYASNAALGQQLVAALSTLPLSLL